MIISIFLTALWLFFTCYGMKFKQLRGVKKEQWISRSGYFILERLQVEQLAASIIQHIHMNLILIEPIGWDYQRTKYLSATKLGEALLVLVGGCWLAVFTKEQLLYTIAILCAVVIIVQLYQGTMQKVKLRKQEMILELPIVLTKMTLLIEAGETLSQAFINCIEKQKKENHPLHREWLVAITMLRNGESFSIVIERLAKRCSVQSVSILATYMLLNAARGGNQFVTSIQDLMSELWDQRKTIARKKGEEASSKLIFPTVIILLILMILIVTPAISLMEFM